MFAGFVYDSSSEGIEGFLVVGSELEGVKSKVEEKVASSYSANDETYSWTENDSGVLTFYPSNEDVEYGGFFWGRVHEIEEMRSIRFSEFG